MSILHRAVLRYITRNMNNESVTKRNHIFLAIATGMRRSFTEDNEATLRSVGHEWLEAAFKKSKPF